MAGQVSSIRKATNYQTITLSASPQGVSTAIMEEQEDNPPKAIGILTSDGTGVFIKTDGGTPGPGDGMLLPQNQYWLIEGQENVRDFLVVNDGTAGQSLYIEVFRGPDL